MVASHEDHGAGIVVCAITVTALGQGELGMLEQAGVVCQSDEMVQVGIG